MVPRVGELIQESWRQATPELIVWAREYFTTRPNAKKQLERELSRWRHGFAEGRTPTDRSTDDGLQYCAFLEAIVGPVKRDVYWAKDRRDAARPHAMSIAGIAGKSKTPPSLLALVQEVHFGYGKPAAVRSWVLDVMKTQSDVRAAVERERDRIIEAQDTTRFNKYLWGYDEYIAELAKDYAVSQFNWNEAVKDTENSRRTTPQS